MKKPIVKTDELDAQYQSIFGDVSSIIDEARQTAARSVNAVMTAAYWMIGQHIVEFEQGGKERAEYGTALVERLAVDLTERFGRGFSRQNIWQMRLFYQSYPPEQILQTLSGESESSENFQTASEESGQSPQSLICQTVSGKFDTTYPILRFRLNVRTLQMVLRRAGAMT